MAAKRARPPLEFPPAAPLSEGEGDRIIYRKHWAVLARAVTIPLFLTLGTATAWASIFASGLAGWILGTSWSTLLAAAVSLLSPAWLWWHFENWRNDLYVLTDDRIIDIERLPFGFRSDVREAPLINVQNVALHIPNMFAASLNYGDVVVETAGRQGTMTFRSVANPKQVLQEISSQVEAVRARVAAREMSQRREELLDWFIAHEELERLKLVASPPHAQVGQEVEIQWRFSGQADEVETHLRWDFISRPDRNYVHGTGIQLGGSGNYGAILRVPLAKCLFFAACARSGGKSYWTKEASLVIRGFSISYPSEVAAGEPVLIRCRPGIALEECNILWWPSEQPAASQLVPAKLDNDEWRAVFSVQTGIDDICFRLEARYLDTSLRSPDTYIALRSLLKSNPPAPAQRFGESGAVGA